MSPQRLKDFPFSSVQGCETRTNGDRKVIRLYDPKRFACYDGEGHRGVVIGERGALRWLLGDDVAEPVPGLSVGTQPHRCVRDEA